MIELNTGQSGEKIVVTLTELQTLQTPYFLFVFTHALTKQVVTLLRYYDDDESDYPERYNQFDIDTAVEFDEKPTGQWLYDVYEQESSTNTDPALAGNKLEAGKMMLQPDAEDVFTQYENETTYITYNG